MKRVADTKDVLPRVLKKIDHNRELLDLAKQRDEDLRDGHGVLVDSAQPWRRRVDALMRMKTACELSDRIELDQADLELLL